MKAGDRYKINSEEAGVLPNLLGLTDLREVEKKEAEGFIKANIILTSSLSNETKFGYDTLAFEKLDSEEMFKEYIVAVQQCGMMNYTPMIQLIFYLFRD